MQDDESRLGLIIERAPQGSRVMVQTVAACSLSEFSSRWPDDAEDMAAIVCGRWIRKMVAVHGDALPPDDAHYIDRVINTCYAELEEEQTAATEKLFDEYCQGGPS